MTEANVSILELVGMSFRKVNPNIIVRSKIMAYQAGPVGEGRGDDPEPGGPLPGRRQRAERRPRPDRRQPGRHPALVQAGRGDRPGRPKCAGGRADERQPQGHPVPRPDSQGRQTIDGVAKNGIQLKVKAKVTVRTNIDRLVGGATDETIIARVGEGIVNAIGSADTHNQVLEKPDSISKRVLEKGLDAGTAYEILSIDIADIDVGDNIGANLQALQAEADTRGRPGQGRGTPGLRRRRGAGDDRRRSRRTAPRSSWPRPRSRWRSPRPSARETSGITDYYHLRNVQADTEMRSSIAGTGNARPNNNPSVVLIPSRVAGTSTILSH